MREQRRRSGFAEGPVEENLYRTVRQRVRHGVCDDDPDRRTRRKHPADDSYVGTCHRRQRAGYLDTDDFPKGELGSNDQYAPFAARGKAYGLRSHFDRCVFIIEPN